MAAEDRPVAAEGERHLFQENQSFGHDLSTCPGANGLFAAYQEALVSDIMPSRRLGPG